MKLDDAIFFNAPVSAKDYPEYYEMIDEPMDMGKLRSELPSTNTLEEFVRKLQLIGANCKTFNAPGSDIITCADVVVKHMKEQIVDKFGEEVWGGKKKKSVSSKTC